MNERTDREARPNMTMEQQVGMIGRADAMSGKPCRPSAYGALAGSAWETWYTRGYNAAAMAEECPHCRDGTHYRVEGDGIAVLRPETLAGCPKFRNELDRAAMAEGGEQ